MIDIGNNRQHPNVAGRVVHAEPPTFGQESIADHASSVAAIMAADPAAGEGMRGCCSAEIVLFNVWTRNDGLDQHAFYNALKSAIDLKLPVVNVSVWLHEEAEDTLLKELLAECARNNVVVVAAAGNAGTSGQVFWPAADDNVIAVAATNPLDQRHSQSSTGRHVFIAAPGENILTTVGKTDYDFVSGTSFAAPFVSAAVWLIKRNLDRLSTQDVRDILRVSVATPGEDRTPELGYGRLDMRRLAAEIARRKSLQPTEGQPAGV
jgi:subtilisin family serine protease